MKRSTTGHLINGIVLIDTPGCGLQEGDTVLVVQPSDDLVFSRRTGQVLGKEEKILGRGVVEQTKDAMLRVTLPKSALERVKDGSGVMEVVAKKFTGGQSVSDGVIGAAVAGTVATGTGTTKRIVLNYTDGDVEVINLSA